jgi:hypothetical protein
MATSFEGLGTGYLGSERSRFKTGEPSMGLALLGMGLQKAGVINDLNDLGNPQSVLRKKLMGYFSSEPRAEPAPVEDRSTIEVPPGMGVNENARAMIPPATAAVPVAPVPVTPAVVPSSPEKTIDDHVNDVIPKYKTGLIQPDSLTPRDSSQDVQILAMASQPVAPPPSPVGQLQGGGSSIAQAVLPQLAKLIFA